MIAARTIARALRHPVALFRGARALERALARLGRAARRPALPDRQVSLTHSARTAIAVASRGVLGVGVDHEADRPVMAAMARWYLRPGESAWVARVDARRRGREMLRLWTVKEALFKADPGNARRALADFELANPAARMGRARAIGAPRLRFRYASARFAGGPLTVALCEGRG